MRPGETIGTVLDSTLALLAHARQRASSGPFVLVGARTNVSFPLLPDPVNDAAKVRRFVRANFPKLPEHDDA